MAYSISTALAIYFVMWWIVLFLTLPFGVRSQHEDGEGAPGTDPGAPILARMGRKLLWTTLISGVRRIAPTFLLFASIIAPASAMDQSAMEETNCLMACDANQENCGAGQASNRNHSLAAYPLHRETKASPVRGAHRTTGLAATGGGTLGHRNEGKR